ncbi:carbohydrate esterase family 8 protein [Diaporthe amygdali]|uniref:carbohydrate esterase family 8 protein n=1 Tax=Phomopsis amygdali TaxID=1214568 RepID=UPI0022FEB14A|nr:carbohydrate esterase family 8 protein [Diaporthe amygdali]KAJ0104406.1 carbohydrate esterase family 8 protein [Diaporthe amygdali]
MFTPGLALAGLAALVPAALATPGCDGPDARVHPPTGAVVVDASGSYTGSYKTVGAGVAALRNQTAEQIIFILPGTYHEQVLVSPVQGPLVFQGYTCDASSYADNEVTITAGVAQKDIPPEVTGETRNDLTSTVRLKSDNVRVYNLNIANTAGNVGQALAVNVNATNVGFYGVNFTGYQDTILSDKGRELFASCYINGAIDFIFGRYAQSWFEGCDIESIGPGYITASGRESDNSSAIYVFNNTKVTGTAGKGSTYLGRPWRPYARVVWQNSDLSDAVNPSGWTDWNGDNVTEHVYFKEFQNTGLGADLSQRVAYSGVLEEAIKITDILGEGYEEEGWVDASYL